MNNNNNINGIFKKRDVINEVGFNASRKPNIDWDVTSMVCELYLNIYIYIYTRDSC